MSLFTEVIPSLQTDTPAAGRELAIMMARKTIATIQPDAEVRSALRPQYGGDSGLLMQAGHIVAVEFATIAAANNYWRP
ncbi:MAG: hexameric tyrosine-coordinated heme protein [Actinomycetota bacterium]